MKVAELATQTSKEFDCVYVHFRSIDTRFTDVDERFDVIDKRFDEVEQRFVKIDERFDEIDLRFIDIDKRFDYVEHRLDNLEFGITDLRADMNRRFDCLFILIDGFAQQSKAHEQEMAMLTSQARRHDRWIHQLSERTNTKLTS